MLAGIVDKAYRTPTVPREREYKGLIVHVCMCVCVRCTLGLVILPAVLSGCLQSFCLPASIQLCLSDAITMFKLQLRFLADDLIFSYLVY